MKTTTKQTLSWTLCVLVSVTTNAGATVNADSSALMWSKPVEVKRVEKPRRTPPKPRPKPAGKKQPVVVEKTPLLSLRWSANKGAWADSPDPAKNPKPINPENTFKIDDHLQLVFTVNQSGFLYIIGKADQELKLLYPHVDINKGANSVQKDKPITIPLNCTPEYQDKNGQCWLKVTDDDDDLVLIFSRDKIDDLHKAVSQDGSVPKELLADIRSGSQQQFSKTNPNTTTVQFTNLNRNDNEELIIETKVRHQ